MKEQVKYVKCISPGKGVDYITAGRVYEVTMVDENACEGYSDTGDLMYIYLPDSSHGVFEVLENYQEDSMSTKKAEPKFGDILHINGNTRVYLSTYGHNSHKLASEDGQIHIVNLEQVDEYAPDPTQELRERILERWKRKSLDNAHDTEACIVEMRGNDLVDFVIENLNAEFEGD